MSLPKSPLLRHMGFKMGISFLVKRNPKKLIPTLSRTCSKISCLENERLYNAMTEGAKPAAASTRRAGGIVIDMTLSSNLIATEASEVTAEIQPKQCSSASLAFQILQQQDHGLSKPDTALNHWHWERTTGQPLARYHAPKKSCPAR